MVSVRRVSRPVGVGIVRRDNLDDPAGFCYAVKLAHEGHHIRHVLDNVAANDLVKFIVGERIRKYAEIVDDVGV